MLKPFFLRIALGLMLSLLFFEGLGQTNPFPHNLSDSDFSFEGLLDSMSTTYPLSMQGWKFTQEPENTTMVAADGNKTLSVKTASATSGNIKNEYSEGISLLNSASNNIGAICVSLNTTGRENIAASWQVQDITSANTRLNGIRLQYRIGTLGDFSDIPSTTYLSNPSSFKSAQQFSNIPLPVTSADEPVVQLRWLYYFVSGSGSRDRLRIDEITITSDEIVVSIDPEPTNQPTEFACIAYGFDEIDLIWDDATGGQLPDGYLVLWSDVSYASIINPVDNTPVLDGAFAQNVLAGEESLEVTGLDQNTDYYFKIFPYTNSGSNIDYKTDGLIQTTSCITDPGPCAFETFNHSNATASYSNGSFIGNNGITWTYVESRNEELTPINGKGLMLRRQSDNSKVYSSTVPNGIGDFTCNLRKGFTGSGNRQVQLFVNGSQIAISLVWDNTNIQTFNVPGINIDGNVVVEIRNITGNQVVVDNIQWTCYSGCTPTQSITSFYSSEGPAQTEVSVFGTGFTGASDVGFGGVSATSFTLVNDTLIKATVPNNGLSGKITVTVADCDKLSANDFTILENNGNCGIGGSETSFAEDLFVSEVYDASSGSLSYVEIFNGTDSDVALSDYSIEINTGPSQFYPMIGPLNSGDTYILRIGTASSSCSDFTPNDNQESAPGFNGDDIINLRFEGNIIDHVPNPGNGAGFSQSRNSGVLSPTTTYNSTEWTISNSENCNNLGIPPFDPNSSNMTITSHPLDVDCDTLTFNVAATTTISPNEPTSYTWRYTAPGDSAWSLVSSLNGSNGLTVTGANTPTITITGNTSLLFDYQFYVDMGTGGSGECRKYSNVASYTFDTRPYYRTITSGNWSDLSIWEMSDNEFGTYEPVCQYPIDRTSDKITIQNGHNVAFDVELTADWIEICPTCTLELLASTKLTLLNGNNVGPDLIVNGTLIDNGNNLNGIDFLDDLSTWEIGNSGTIIKTYISSVTQYRDNYEGGIGMIPADANWIYRRTNNNDISVATVNMVYPNLSFENSFGTSIYDPTSPQYIFSGNYSSVRVKGDLNIGMTGSGTYIMKTINSHPDPILIEGSLNIGAGSSLLNSSGTDTGTGIEVRADLEIEGTLDLSTGTDAGVGILKFLGANDMIGVGTGTVIANHIIIDKDPGAGLLTELNFVVEESAQFLNGILELDNAANVFTFRDGAITINASNASFVDGRVRKTASPGEEFSFPIGDVKEGTTAWYQPARIFGQSAQTTIDAQYFAEAHPFAGAYYDGQSNSSHDNQEIGNCDYWQIDSISGANVKLALKYTNADPEYCNVIVNSSILRIASLNEINNWDNTDSAPNADEIEMGVVIGTVPTGGSYGVFAFQSSGLNLNVLPVQLTSFTAKPENQKVQTAWTTETETNNAYFTVERSADARVFQEIGQVTGAGNSHTPQHYAFTDDKPLPGVSYYRLKQTDFDGQSSHSDVVAVSFTESDAFSLDLTYRDENQLNLVYNSISPYILVEIFDVLGKRVFTEIAENYGGRSVLSPGLGRGAYVVRISSGNKSDSGKIVW